jgi:hypothetical protein
VDLALGFPALPVDPALGFSAPVVDPALGYRDRTLPAPCRKLISAKEIGYQPLSRRLRAKGSETKSFKNKGGVAFEVSEVRE